MYTIYSYSDLEKIKFDNSLMKEVKREIENIQECVGKNLKLGSFSIKEYGKIVVIDNELEFINLTMSNNGKYSLFNLESEQWIIENDSYYVVNGVEYNGLFIEIIIKEEIYKKFDVTYKYYIEHNLKRIKKNNGKVQILSY